MRNRRFRDASPKEKIHEGLGVAGAGLIWTIGGSILYLNFTKSNYYPFYWDTHISDHNSLFWIIVSFGILVIIVGLGTALSGYIEMTEEKNEYERRAGEAAHKAEEPARMAEPARESKPGGKKIVFCPYCGSAMDADYKVCGSCGAGRTKSV